MHFVPSLRDSSHENTNRALSCPATVCNVPSGLLHLNREYGIAERPAELSLDLLSTSICFQ